MKDQKKSISDCVRRLYNAQQEKKRFDKYYEETRKKEQLCISNYMFSFLPKGTETFDIQLDEGMEFYDNPVSLKVTKVRSKKIVWFIDRLKETLTKEQYKKVTTKTYTVNDMHGLINYLKQCGVDAKKFKKFIDVSETLDEQILTNMYDTNQITREQIKGCYELKLGEPYIRLTEIK